MIVYFCGLKYRNKCLKHTQILYKNMINEKKKL